MNHNGLTFGNDNHAGYFEQWYGSTNDNATKTLSSMTISNNSVGDLTITGTAFRLSDMSRISWLFFCSFKKVGSGHPKIEVHKISEIGDTKELKQVQFDIIAVDNNIHLVGTGLANTAMGWQYTCRGLETSN